MKIASLDDLPEEPSAHNPEIKKKTMLGNGDLPHELTFGQVNFAPGQIVIAHSHDDIYEVVFLKSGIGAICIDGESYHLKPDTCVLLEPNETHEIVNTGSGNLELLFFQAKV